MPHRTEQTPPCSRRDVEVNTGIEIRHYVVFAETQKPCDPPQQVSEAACSPRSLDVA